MAERPNQNWESRDIDSRGTKYRVDIGNPQMGDAGKNAYMQIGITENDTTQFSALTETGTYMLHCEKSIEIVSAEPTNSSTAIKISAQKGDLDIVISDGQIKIKGRNIVMESATDITMKAGRNITLNAASRILLKGLKVDASGLLGNLIEKTVGGFLQRAFKGSKVGEDYLSNPPPGDKFISKPVVSGTGDLPNLGG